MVKKVWGHVYPYRKNTACDRQTDGETSCDGIVRAYMRIASRNKLDKLHKDTHFSDFLHKRNYVNRIRSLKIEQSKHGLTFEPPCTINASTNDEHDRKWSCMSYDRCDTGRVAPDESITRHDTDYKRDVTSTLATSRGQDHATVQPTDCCTAHVAITLLGTGDVKADARTATTSGLSAVIGLLDEAPLFYVSLTSGATFAACVTSVCPSWVVAVVAVTSFVSFAVDSARRYVIAHRSTVRWRLNVLMLMLSDRASVSCFYRASAQQCLYWYSNSVRLSVKFRCCI